MLQQSQLTMLADCHERVEAISSRLNDFFTVVETQIRGLRTLIDTTLSYGDPGQSRLKVVRGTTKGQLARNVVKNAFEDLEETLKKQLLLFGKILSMRSLSFWMRLYILPKDLQRKKMHVDLRTKLFGGYLKLFGSRR